MAKCRSELILNLYYILASREGRTGSPQLQPLGENTSWLPSVIAVVERGRPISTEIIQETENGTSQYDE